jgi:hypothetical protein
MLFQNFEQNIISSSSFVYINEVLVEASVTQNSEMYLFLVIT